MSFKIEQNSVLLKYNDIWNKTKKILNMKFYSTPIYDQKYIRIKVKNGVVNTIFWNDGTPNENVHYTFIAPISIDSVMRMDKKNYLQVYLKDMIRFWWFQCWIIALILIWLRFSMQKIFYWSNFPLTQEIFLVVYILRKGGRNLRSIFFISTDF